jgi:hypothetical protein
MAAAGVDTAAAAAQGRLMMLDAAATLSRFMNNDSPYPAAFDAVVGRLVRAMSARGRPVRAYGEMVALLWNAGNVAGAMDLERLWNDLGEQVPFSLFCSYPSHLVADAHAADSFAEVCHLHSRRVNAAPTPGGLDLTRRFAGNPQCSTLARRFVADSLRGWGREDLVSDGMLVVAELATNAMMHARSDFTVGLSRCGETVRLVVGDASPVEPAPPSNTGPDSIGGRGLRIVEVIVRRWGHQPIARGKLVWAEL